MRAMKNNKKILRYTLVFSIIYMLLPVIFFELMLEYDILFYIFFFPSIVLYGINFTNSEGALLYYAVFIVIFWIICFLLVKLISVVMYSALQITQKNQKNRIQ